jgi:Stress responsive A/B Barrel Domain
MTCAGPALIGGPLYTLMQGGVPVFRQVVVGRWADGVSPEAKQGFRDAIERLRAIPELLAMTWGDDAGHFDDNFDFVAVMDFADFAAALRYVDHPLHQSYVQDHASQIIGERAIVQHEWTAPGHS